PKWRARAWLRACAPLSVKAHGRPRRLPLPLPTAIRSRPKIHSLAASSVPVRTRARRTRGGKPRHPGKLDRSQRVIRVDDLIELRNIHKTYHLGEVDLPVLKGVSLKAARGELVALMGASGSGKSTLMNILGCLDHPTSGEYWLDGREISRLTAKECARLRNRMIGFVFQSFNLLPRMTALENVVMPLMYCRDNLTEREMERRAAELIEKVGLAGRLHHRPSQLSGGEQQRVAIARSLI